MNRSKVLVILVIILLCALSVYTATRWESEMRLDNILVWLSPPEEKATRAAQYSLQRIGEMQVRSDEEAIFGAYSIQDLLSAVEQNINIAGNPRKVLRKQQTVEDDLRVVKEHIAGIDAKSEEYKLVLKHISARIDLLLQEVDLAKKKTKTKIDT